jgi:4-hydroxyproline epimerase
LIQDRIMQRMHIVDSHTAGEPTRVVLAGGPDLGPGTMAQRLEIFRSRYDRFRSAVVNEPRGSDVLVGALLCDPAEPAAGLGAIFFNHVGYLGMCGHGAIGLVATLAWLGRLQPGTHRLETPVGTVDTILEASGSVSIENVVSFRREKGVTISVPGQGTFTGDVAWGGNWFFLVSDHGQELTRANADRLVDLTCRIREAVHAAGFPEVDHVELFGPPSAPGADSRNFVLCPGRVYDRSPCGTGTSAKLACLAADAKLAEGSPWVQESILGTTFTGRFRWADQCGGRIVPTITGTAYVTAESQLILDERDPFCWGIRAA